MKTPNARIEQIIRAARKYRRTVHALTCRYDADLGAFIYGLTCAKAGSGSRGGRLKAHQHYRLVNLCPEQREALLKRIGKEPGAVIGS